MTKSQNDIIRIEIPERLRQESQSAPRKVRLSLLPFIPLLGIAIYLIFSRGTEDVNRGFEIVLAFVITLLLGLIGLALLAVVNKYVLRSLSNSMVGLVQSQSSDPDLMRAIKVRFGKTMLFNHGEVTGLLQRIRLSSHPNADGSFWMLSTDSRFSFIEIQKYWVGNINEPNDPDSFEALYPSFVNPDGTVKPGYESLKSHYSGKTKH